MIKSTLRAYFLAQRRSLPADEVVRRSNEIARLFFDSCLTAAPNGILHTFLPIARQNEVDTWPIIHRLRSDFPNIRVSVSVTDIAANQLTHYALSPETTLHENRWGIPEPVITDQPAIDSGQIDWVLVPLLAFDERGHRVGYGKGYYDRFLSGCRPDCLKIGLSLFEPVRAITDIDATDVRLDACITPAQVYSF